MPYNVFLHSALVQSRKVDTRKESRIREAINYYSIECTVALLISFLINVCVTAVFAKGFHGSEVARNIGLENAGNFLQEKYGGKIFPILYIWGIGLLASGQSSTIAGTYAGQFIMGGFLNLRLKKWVRALITRSCAIVPTIVVALFFDTGEATMDILNEWLNVLQAIQIPFALIPLLTLVSKEQVMGTFRIGRVTEVVTWVVVAFLISINGYLLLSFLSAEVHGTLMTSILCAALAMYVSFVIYLILQGSSLHSRLALAVRKSFSSSTGNSVVFRFRNQVTGSNLLHPRENNASCLSGLAGCANGSCVIWDFETRGVAKELRDKACVAPITSVCWSKYGHYLLASATDKSLTLWNVMNGEKITHITLQQTTLHARLHPGSCTPSLCLACPLSSAPILVDLNNGSSTVLPVSVTDNTNGNAVSHPRNKFSDGSLPFTPTAATFDKHGDLIYLGNSKGEILIVDSNNIRVNALIPIPGGSVVKDIVFSRNGQYLLTNSNDRVIRVYENLLPTKGAAKELEIMSDTNDKFPRIEKLKEVGTKCLRLSREFQDAVTKIQWKAPCFSGDGEWVIGASASKGEHKLYIWDRAGHLVKILEGPKEALIDLAWHPLRPLVVSVSVAGLVYIWAKDYTENWSAFAPDFKELEENEEYVEREDEFDLMPESEKVKELVINQDEEVDILTVEKDSAFSDSDASQEELCFLPAVPLPDVPEQQDKCLGSSLKLGDSNHTGSLFSVEAAQNGQAILPASSPFEVVGNSTPEEAVGTAGLKRKRKPSAKGMELQAEKGRKPQTKNKASGKLSKPKSRSGDGIDTNGSVLEDDVTDEYL
ncbi:hypothetical protein BHE74_00026866 [Ensete ventricosum]|nr:hypothetical protein BHE74_00026866 [Ensete ventricosum]